MGNLSYCRFQNTLRDLRDCYENMEADSALSSEERRAKEQLLELCERFVKDYG